MDIKLFSGDKEIIAPLFDFRINQTKNSLMLCISSFSINEQENFSKQIESINKNNFFLNSNYIALNFNNIIYYFDLSNFKEEQIENLLISGSYDFMFAFIDENDRIVERDYLVMKLNGYKLKEL